MQSVRHYFDSSEQQMLHYSMVLYRYRSSISRVWNMYVPDVSGMDLWWSCQHCEGDLWCWHEGASMWLVVIAQKQERINHMAGIESFHDLGVLPERVESCNDMKNTMPWAIWPASMVLLIFRHSHCAHMLFFVCVPVCVVAQCVDTYGIYSYNM